MLNKDELNKTLTRLRDELSPVLGVDVGDLTAQILEVISKSGILDSLEDEQTRKTCVSIIKASAKDIKSMPMLGILIGAILK